MLGIAVCAMYATGAMVLTDGLQEGSGSVVAGLRLGPFLAFKGGFPSDERFYHPDGLTGNYSVGALDAASMLLGNVTFPIRTFFLEDPRKVGMVQPDPQDAYLSPSLAASLNLDPGANITLATSYAEVGFTFRDLLRAPLLLPDQWILVPVADHEVLHPIALDVYNFVLLQERSDALHLQRMGFSVLSTASAGDFFLNGLSEARRIVQNIVVVSSVAIAALVFSLLSLEARYRRDEMVTLRALGMDGRGMMGLYGLQTAFVVAVGTTLGVALGIVVANGLVSFAPFFGLPTIVQPQVTFTGILLPLLSSLAAGALGGTAAILVALRRFSRGA